MPTYKVTWKFAGPGGATWNEQFYTQGANVLAASKPPPHLQMARLKLLHPLFVWRACVAADVDNKRITKAQPINLAGTAAGAGATNPAPAGVSAAITLGSSIGSRKLSMRGWPRSSVVLKPSSGQFELPGDVQVNLAYFLGALEDAGYGMRKITGQTTGALVNQIITKVDGSIQPGLSTITWKDAATFTFPGRVIISGASKKDLPGLNGRWQIVSSPLPTSLIVRYQTPQGAVVEGGNGHIRQEVYQAFAVFDSGSSGFGYWGTRDTKNASTGSRGARRAQRIRTIL